MAPDGERNTSQDRRRGSDVSSGARGWETSGKATSSKPQNKSPAKPGAGLRPTAPAWGGTKQTTTTPPSTSGSGMQLLKGTTDGSPSKPSVITPPSTSSWAALLGGGGGSAKTPPKAATIPVVPAEEKTTDSSPVSPRSFSFQRGNGVVLVHEAPLSPRSPQSPKSAKAAVVDKETSPHVAVPALSWAEKAKLAASQAPAPVPPRRTAAAAGSAGVTKAKASPPQQQQRGQSSKAQTTQVTSPKRSQGAPPRSPGGPDLRHKNNNNNKQQQQQQEKSRAAANKQPQLAHPTKKSAVELDPPPQFVPKIVPKVVPEPKLPMVSMEKGDDELNKDVNDATKVEDKISISPPSVDVEAALDILCSSLAAWKLPQNSNSTASSSSSLLHHQQGQHHHQRVQPRGIKNPGNLCFVNAVLQGLMGSSSFCQILLALSSLSHSSDDIINTKAFPVLSAMINVAAEFSEKVPENVKVLDTKADNDTTKAKNSNLITVLGGHPVSSALIMDIINQFTPRQQQQQQQQKSGASGGEGQVVEQEDAHEFLHFLLDKMDSELVALRKAVEKSGKYNTREETLEEASETSPPPPPLQEGAVTELDSFEDDDGWLVKSGKKAVRQQEVSAVGTSNEAASVITALFQGKFATSVACAGAPNSVTVHPFMIVELPIYADSIRSISDSFDALTAAEVLEDYKPAAGAIPQQAAKTERFLHVPDVLVLHLMRFQFTGKSAKISKYVSFEPRLVMKSSWMATGTPDRGAIYDLVATVTHHGKTIGRGHYTSDVVQPDGKWLRFDDSDVYWVKEQQVLSDTPYLLVYQRQR